ncbi:hypothetical protein WUBG_00646 [Wuchereria bancrofti]|uniref:Uncharacterized protein n=1 Tax=Wuchereria bancrofti TaxID=6293 RepID=J9FFM0_WUCBA|nr:hypothetical protein WUBG_00646 [Wuchereria bancrofti]
MVRQARLCEGDEGEEFTNFHSRPMIPSSLLTRPIYGFFPIHKIRLGK